MNIRISIRSLAWSMVVLSVVRACGGESQAWAGEPGLAALASAGSTTNLLTLERLVELALANNPEFRASEGRVDAAAGRASQAGLWSNPELSLATEDIPARSGSFRDSKNTLGLTQTLPFPGKKKLEKQIGTQGVIMSEAEWNLRRLELIRDVKSGFYQVLAAERLAGVARELVQVAESSVNTARKRVEAGAAADQEQLRAEIQMDQARTELAGYERGLAAARMDLAVLLGQTTLDNFVVSGALTETAERGLLDRKPEEWLPRHPSVASAKAVLDRANLELKRARLEPYPDVSVGVDGGREGASDASIIEFRVGLPLPLIDRSKGRKQETRANLRVAQAELTAAKQKLLRDWGVASQRFRTAAEQVSAYRDRILPKTAQALKLVQTGFEEGRFGFIDLLDTQRTTAEARLAYQEKLLELNRAQVELEALVTPEPAEPSFKKSSQPAAK